jgi:hypothetical protein
VSKLTFPLALVLLVFMADGVGNAAVTSPHPAWQWVRLAIALAAAGLGLVAVLATRDDRWLRP